MPETDSEQGDFAAEGRRYLTGDSSFVGSAWTGTYENVSGVEPGNALDIACVVAGYPHFRSEFAQILYKVVGE
jgi:hypothetical protein